MGDRQPSGAEWDGGEEKERERGSVGGKGRRKGGTMIIRTAKIFWLGLNELNDEKAISLIKKKLKKITLNR